MPRKNGEQQLCPTNPGSESAKAETVRKVKEMDLDFSDMMLSSPLSLLFLESKSHRDDRDRGIREMGNMAPGQNLSKQACGDAKGPEQDPGCTTNGLRSQRLQYPINDCCWNQA